MSPIDDDGHIRSGPNGLAMLTQFFEFDPSTKRLRLGGKSGFSQMIYGNTLIDSVHITHATGLDFGELITPDDISCADIGIEFVNHKKVLISSNYIISPAEAGQPAVARTDGYSVSIVFDPRDQKKSVPGTLKVSRNGQAQTQFKLDFSAETLHADLAKTPWAKSGFPIVDLSKVQRGRDIIEWSVEQEGTITHKGIIGFPVMSTVPRLVYYSVDISDHKIASK